MSNPSGSPNSGSAERRLLERVRADIVARRMERDRINAARRPQRLRWDVEKAEWVLIDGPANLEEMIDLESHGVGPADYSEVEDYEQYEAPYDEGDGVEEQ